MANRERSHTSSSEPSSPREAYEAGRTTLNLDDISEEQLDTLSFGDEANDASAFNLQTVSGLALILAGILYLLTEIGVWSEPALLGLGAALPWVMGTVVILLGFGVLTWRSSTSAAPSPAPPPRAGTRSDASDDDPPSPAFSGALARSRTDKKFLGVCGGIARYLNVDPTLVRVAFVLGTIFSFGPLVLAYFGLAIAMPKDPPRAVRGRRSSPRDD